MILMIYNAKICKEILLPNLHDAEYTVYLQKDICRLSQNVKLRLDNSSKGWKILRSGSYQVKEIRNAGEDHILRDQEILEVKTTAGDQFQIVVVDCELKFQVMEKYDIRSMVEISIGNNVGNLIQYGFMDLVSGFHATLKKKSDGWYLIDTSKNGTFLGNQRVEHQTKLMFGDRVDIFGLHLLFLGSHLALGAYYGNLHVNESILCLAKFHDVEEKIIKVDREYEEVYFHRSPRNLPVIYQGEEEIEAPPTPKIMKEKPIYMTIGPAFTMAIPMLLGCSFAILGSRLSGYTSGIFMYTGLITAVSSALIGVVWAILNLNYSKKEEAKEEALRFNAYSNYLIQIAESLRGKYEHNTKAMHLMYPAAEECLRYNENSSQLWNRNFTHGDFLYQRVGLGDQPFQIEIKIPKEKFTMVNDTLLEKPGIIRREFMTLRNVPVGISLMDKRLIGLVGGKYKEGAIQIMHSLVTGIAASHCYTDVKLVFIYREEDQKRRKNWECMRWLPHIWSEDKSIRYMASDELEINDIFFELSGVIRMRSQNTEHGRVKPHYVIFVSDPSILEGELIAKYIYEAKPEYGITTCLMVENLEDLPNECEDVIQNDRYFRGIYSLMDTGENKQEFVPDKVSPDELTIFGQRLANIRVNETESTNEIPATLDFFEMYGVHTLRELHIDERWRKNRTYNSMKALIGKKAGKTDCYLDIHEKFHGPHGLVAGTTGSGKSETLQTYILSLAVNFSPEDVVFLIIDFKGGGMANLFSELPHLSGQISNLSGNQVHRAMISIKSENLRRQRLFSEYGVNNINSYTRLYKNHETETPIPHLFIIIDEFAELKKEEPDFMKELISVAQVGRSLGVHLILATQKPSGTVDDNIWSNSKFRICLRVQDRQDSNDMLHKPDAAFITQAGRAYLQVGNDEIYEMFQSGYSGAIYEEYDGTPARAAVLLTRTGKAELVGGYPRKRAALELSSEKERTQLEVVIEYMNRLAKKSGYQNKNPLWLPLLKKSICLEELFHFENRYDGMGQWKDVFTSGKWELKAAIGMYDDPERQMQDTLYINFSEGGHHALLGAVSSGKSTFLQTLVYAFLVKYSPQVLQMYLLDFSSHMLAPFEKAPHIGGVIYENQDEKLTRFFFMLGGIMEERKQILRGGSYAQYVQAHGAKLPAIVVVIDHMASFRDKTKYAYDEEILRIAREGIGYGIYLIVSSAGIGMSEIPSRLADHMRTILSLEQADKFKYMEALRMTRLEILPEVGIKGRGLAVLEGRVLEYQTALSVQAEDDFTRSQKLEQICVGMRNNWKGKKATAIPEIPDKPVLELLCEEERYQDAIRTKDLLPFGYRRDNAGVYSMDLSQNYCYMIMGKDRTGKKNTLKTILHAAWKKGGKLCVIERETSDLKKTAERYQATYIQDDMGLFQYLSELLPEFKKRNIEKRKLMENGLEDRQIFDVMSEYQPIFIFLTDFTEFMRMIYKPEEGVGNMSGFVENIMEKGKLHHIYFIGCIKLEDQSFLGAYRAYSLFVSYKKGIHLGGNLVSQQIFSFQNIPYAEQAKSQKRGLGYVPDDEEENNGIQVVIPLVKNK